MSVVALRQKAIERTETALVLPEGLPEAAWRAVGEELGRANRASAWWIGDWINYGEGAGYVSRETYAHAVEITGLAPNTLWNYASVARRFQSFNRVKDLSFKHHRRVMALPPAEADRLLMKAAREGWTSKQLEDEVPAPAKRRVTSPQRRHEDLVSLAATMARLAEGRNCRGWERSMTDTLTPPQARKQLTILRKAEAALTEIIEAVEYRAATPYQFMGR